VDTNVLIFERVKEELRRGKMLKTAVEIGFEKAWPSIRDSNISTIITCVLLFVIGTSIVRGFAVTLGLGVVVSMFTGIIIARWMARRVARWPLARQAWLFPGMAREAAAQ
jgi:preprotein translocase subunit SecD